MRGGAGGADALTLSNIRTVKSGNAAPTAERTMVFAASADAAYIMYVSIRYACVHISGARQPGHASREAGRGTHHEGDEDHADARADRDRRERGDVPRHAGVVARPSEPERAEDEERRAEHRAEEALLGRGEPAPCADEARIVPRRGQEGRRAEARADAHADEDEPALVECEAARVDENDREGFEYWRCVRCGYGRAELRGDARA